MRVRLDRTVCDGFGICGRHAPDHFTLDDWGYASLTSNARLPEAAREQITRAVLDCPAHAISFLMTPSDEQHPTVSTNRPFTVPNEESR